MRELAVYYNDTEAGILTEKYPGADYTFQYKEDYINSALPPISATLPKQSTAFNSEHLFPFFSNMVPEGANRRVICRSLRLDENDFFWTTWRNGRQGLHRSCKYKEDYQ